MTFEQKVASFWARVDRNGPLPERNPELGPCWLWTGGKNDDGYGTFCVSDGGPHQANRGAHRVAFFFANGRWPEPEIDHLCFRPSCVRIDHLRETSHSENMNARRCSKICHAGHPLEGENKMPAGVLAGRKRWRCRACYEGLLKLKRAERMARGLKCRGPKVKYL